MAKLDIRGHEVVDPVPFEPVVPVKKPFDMMAYVRQQILREKMEADDQIRNESDLAEDMLDFETEHTYGDDLIGPSPYEIGDDVPDGYAFNTPEGSKSGKPMPEVNSVETAPETPSTSQE